MSAVERELQKRIAELDAGEKEQVLEFTRTLDTRRQGTPGAALLRFAGRIPKEDLRQIRDAIEGGCEQVDPDGW